MNENEIKAIRVLSEDFPLVSQPYKVLAERVGLSEDELLDITKRLKNEGKIRRISLVLKHQKAGFLANALCVWRVEEERLDEIGERFSKEKYLTHCYTRKVLSNWSYNLYTMIHATTREECEKIIHRLARENNIFEYRLLYSVKEYKKQSLKYSFERENK